MKTADVQKLIKELLEKMDLSVSDIVISQEDGSNSVWYSAEVDKPHLFTAREGEALHALNHLVRRVVESQSPEAADAESPSLLIDIGGFQKKRQDNVRAIAHMIAERARYFKSSVEVEPMSAFDRRIVHEFIAKHPDLKSESIGNGPTRRVVIKYVETTI